MKVRYIFSIFLFLSFLSSCGSRKDVLYFQDSNNVRTIESDPHYVVKIMPNDNLYISVSTINPQASEVFNIVRTGGSSTSTLEWQGYLVNDEGDINFPIVGKIHLAGLTKKQAVELLENKVAKYVENPIVNLRFLNYRVHILGEVGRPGPYTISSEKVTIPEALALAGDMTLYGDRRDVIVCRDENGAKKFYHVDMTSSSVFFSEVYYLQQNDILYIQPNAARARNSTNYTTNISVFVSITSIILTVATFFIVTVKK